MTLLKWESKNYGGDPTTNESKKYAIFVGRFQPYHHKKYNFFILLLYS